MNARAVLILDDDVSLLHALKIELQREFRVYTTDRAEQASRLIVDVTIDLCLIDYYLGQTNGHAVIRQIRERFPAVPCVLMTAQADKDLAIESVNLGINGFLEKPFASEALRECLDRLLPASARDGDLRLDGDTHSVRLGDRTILLTPIEFRILAELWKARGRLVLRDQICATLWGTTRVTEHTFDTHFTNMKRKIPELRNRIQVVRGQGYILAP